MIILFGKKECKKTHIEKHTLEAAGRRLMFFDIDTKKGKEELRKRGLFYEVVSKNLPWIIDEKD